MAVNFITDLDPKTAEIIQLAALPMGDPHPHLKSFNRFTSSYSRIAAMAHLGTCNVQCTIIIIFGWLNFTENFNIFF